MKVTAAESTILKVLWRVNVPTPADAVVAMLGENREWSAGTVRTFLARLVKKEGRRYLYCPLISREDYAHQESRNLIDRLFNGRITPFVTQLSERHDLSRQEIADLKRLIRKLDRER